MQKVSDHIAEELKTAQAKRDKAPTREVSYWQGQVDALQLLIDRAKIIELTNEYEKQN